MSLGHVYLIDDDDDVRAAIEILLRFAGYEVQSWSSAQDFLAEPPRHAPAVLVTDMQMPGLRGLDLHRALLEKGSRIPLIYISGESTLALTIEAMKLGPCDFLLKPISREDLLRAVAAAMERDRIAMQGVIQKARMEVALRQLSPREAEVHGLLVRGFSNSEIVEALGVSLPTAKQYKSEVMRKLGVRSLSQLIEWGRDLQAGT